MNIGIVKNNLLHKRTQIGLIPQNLYLRGVLISSTILTKCLLTIIILFTFSLSQAVANEGVFVQMQTMYGIDPAGIRLQNLTATSVDIKIEEEQSFDTETAHIPETVGYLRFDLTTFSSLGLSTKAEVGSVTVTQPDADTWHTVNLTNTYTKPVVLMQMVTYLGIASSHVRISSVTPTSFKYKIEEWNYLDGIHVQETLNYLVIDEGEYPLADGNTLIAGTQSGIDHNFADINWSNNHIFSETPVVLSQTQTFGSGDAIVTRQEQITTTGFRVRVQEEESDTIHATETVGYIAIEVGYNEYYNVNKLTIDDGNWNTSCVGPLTNDSIINTQYNSYIDTQTCLEWMDFGINTAGYDYVVSQLGEGGLYEGWIADSDIQVKEMFAHAFLNDIVDTSYPNYYGPGNLRVDGSWSSGRISALQQLMGVSGQATGAMGLGHQIYSNARIPMGSDSYIACIITRSYLGSSQHTTAVEKVRCGDPIAYPEITVLGSSPSVSTMLYKRIF